MPSGQSIVPTRFMLMGSSEAADSLPADHAGGCDESGDVVLESCRCCRRRPCNASRPQELWVVYPLMASRPLCLKVCGRLGSGDGVSNADEIDEDDGKDEGNQELCEGHPVLQNRGSVQSPHN